MDVRRPVHTGEGCSVPCILCRQLLQAFDLKVTCVVSTAERFVGKLDDPHAPKSVFTSGQQRFCGFKLDS